MPKIPRDGALDAAFPVLLKNGYLYIQDTCKRLDSEIFETRVLGRRAICFLGEEAGRAFYDSELFLRHGAAPKRILKGLIGKDGVHSLDGEDHRDRKEMFMALMSESRLKLLSEIAIRQWDARIAYWKRMDRVVLHEEARKILCATICDWVGVPLSNGEFSERAHDLGEMIDSFGAVGPRYWRGVIARIKTESWMRRMVDHIRSGLFDPPRESAAYQFAFHRNAEDRYLDSRIAAVELINVIRPTVALSYLITFAALALLEHPEWRSRLHWGDKRDLEFFVQEVRRYFPFASVVAAVARKDFLWKGYPIPKGRLVILDLYGTNHDPRYWTDPYEFQPDRFRSLNGSPYGFIPNGGGDFGGHRCAGEWITIEMLKTAVYYLASVLEYDVPKQDLEIPLTRIPALPRSKFVMSRVREASWPVGRLSFKT